MPVLFPAAPPRLCAARASRSAMASAARSSSSSAGSFDAAAFETERLRLDAAAEADPRAWKWAIRKRGWVALEAEGVARDPRPLHHRIPNFDGAPAAADAVRALAISPGRSASS